MTKQAWRAMKPKKRSGLTDADRCWMFEQLNRAVCINHLGIDPEASFDKNMKRLKAKWDKEDAFLSLPKRKR